MRLALFMALFLLSPSGEAYAEVRNAVGRDGAAMVLIAEGPFVRGSVAEQGDADERRSGSSTSESLRSIARK